MAGQSFDARHMTKDQHRRAATAAAIGLNALKPMLQFQVSLLRVWANNVEMFLRNYETALDTFSADAEQPGNVEQREHPRAA